MLVVGFAADLISVSLLHTAEQQLDRNALAGDGQGTIDALSVSRVDGVVGQFPPLAPLSHRVLRGRIGPLYGRWPVPFPGYRHFPSLVAGHTDVIMCIVPCHLVGDERGYRDCPEGLSDDAGG